ncbi:hypothetical protein, partial [Streptomyces sp. NPDC002265]|uniref:hypothetical protein n=1 Tax=Streptomyces sp. NPDC002265 TaxID=3154415 RepID=UPI00331B856A
EQGGRGPADRPDRADTPARKSPHLLLFTRQSHSLAVVLFARDVDAAVTALEESGIGNGSRILTVDDLE